MKKVFSHRSLQFGKKKKIYGKSSRYWENNCEIRSLSIKLGELEYFRKLAIYKMTSVRKSYTFQSLLKNITLLSAERFENINLHQQTVLLKIIYDFWVEISFLEK